MVKISIEVPLSDVSLQRVQHESPLHGPAVVARILRLEAALNDALNLLEADGSRHNVWRSALDNKPWPPASCEACGTMNHIHDADAHRDYNQTWAGPRNP